MASKADIERMQARLKLKSEQLQTRVRINEAKDKLADLNRKLKNMGGRVR